MRKIFFALLFLGSVPIVLAQNKRVLDSLSQAYLHTRHDSSKSLILSSISQQYRISKPDTGIYIGEKALQISEKIGFDKGKNNACYVIGTMYEAKGNYTQALSYLQKSLALSEKLKNDRDIIKNLNQLGSIYGELGNFTKSLENHQRALDIDEKAGNLQGVSRSLNNIGNTYSSQGESEKALEYYYKCLAIKEKIGDKQGVARSLHNIGVIYDAQGKTEKALETLQKGLEIRDKLGDKRGVASILSSIGAVYRNQGKYDLSLECYEKSLEVHEKLNEKKKIVPILNGIAQTYQKKGDYQKSISYAERSLQMSEAMQTPEEIRDANYTLYETYKLQGNHDKALAYHERYKQTNDTIFNIQKVKSVANLESKMALEKKQKEMLILSLDAESKARELEITKKQAESEQLFALARAEKDKRKQDSLYNLAQKAQLEAENLKAQEEKKRLQQEKNDLAYQAEANKQKQIQQTFIGISFGLLIVIILVFLGLRQKQVANKALKQRQAEVLQLNNALVETNQTLKITTSQIQQSIHAAKTIQQVMLPNKNKMNAFFQTYFVLYKPKDVVSGDFYWVNSIQNKILLVVADCTGHGVPGAFMTLIANQLLDKIVRMAEITNPAEILTTMHTEVQNTLKQNETGNDSGMDMSILSIEPQAQDFTVLFAGAKQNLLMRLPTDTQIQELKGTRKGIGGIQNPDIFFENYALQLPKDTFLYLRTDGLEDQNNLERKKFGKAKIIKILENATHRTLELQKNALEKALSIYAENTTQRDDILWVGIKL